jgi:hypothetical protein
VKYLRVL